MRRAIVVICVLLVGAYALTHSTREVRAMAAISNVSLGVDANGDAQLSFVESWDGQTRVVKKSDVPAGVNTVTEVENWFNNTYFPSILTAIIDGHIVIRGYAAIHITKLSPLTYLSIFSSQPIPANWFANAP